MMGKITSLSWETIVKKAINHELITMEEGLKILGADDAELLSIMHAAYQVRFHFFHTIGDFTSSA